MNRAGTLSVLLACFGLGMDCTASEPGFYVGGDLAYVIPTVGKSDGFNFGSSSGVVHATPESVRFESSETGWSAMIGYRISRYLSAELAYMDFGPIDVEEAFDIPPPVGPAEFSSSFNLRTTGPMVSVLGFLPLTGRIQVYGRAGILWARQEVTTDPRFSFDDAEERWGLGVGLQAELGSGWSARIEYQRFEDIDSTEFSGELRLEQLLLGAAYRLGSAPGMKPTPTADAKPYKSGFYIVTDLGITEPSVGKSDGFLVSFSNFPGLIFHLRPRSLTADDAGVGGSVALGYRINRYFAAELSYADFGDVDVEEHYVLGPIDSPFFPPIPRIDIEVDLTSRIVGPSAGVLGILPVTDEFEFFARAGVLLADHEVARSPGDRAASDADELFVWGTGFDVELSDRWAVRVAYENVESLRKTSYTGPIRIERFAFGVSYDF